MGSSTWKCFHSCLDGFGSADPADRFLVATALDRELVLVTADEAMRAYDPVQTLW